MSETIEKNGWRAGTNLVSYRTRFFWLFFLDIVGKMVSSSMVSQTALAKKAKARGDLFYRVPLMTTIFLEHTGNKNLIFMLLP